MRRTQEERSTATRAALLDATIACLIEEGYAQTTTHKVAARAGVSRGAMLHHFPAKAELVAEAVDHLGRRRLDELAAKARALPDRPDRAAAALEVLWDAAQSPLFGASVDLWAASRTDAELRERLRPVERAFAERLLVTCEELFGEDISRRPDFARSIEIAFAQIRGLVVMSPFDRSGRARAATWRSSRAALSKLFHSLPVRRQESRMSNRTFVIGVGMTKFDKPGTKEGDYPEWAKEAGEKALADAGIPYETVEQAFAGYVYGDSTYGQRAVYQLGLTGIPVVNVNNNCSTGSSALWLARQAVKGGLVQCALAIGFEKMEKGSLGMKYTDRTPSMDKHMMRMFELRAPEQSPFAPQMFGNAGRDHMQKYGSTADHYAWIGWKNHKHSVNNPYAQFQDEYSLDEIKAARMIHDPLTKLQCSPTSDGSAAVLVASERFVDEHDLWDQAIEMAGQSMVTDLSSTFDEAADCIKICGYDMSREAARQAYEEAGVDASQVDVCELHDCFSANELITYEALGFAAEGEGHKLVDTQATTYGGDGPVVNPSGGLISKGHPLGATGLAQCSELTWQLRGTADKRQVDGAKLAVQHNIGLGGAAVVTVYKPAA